MDDKKLRDFLALEQSAHEDAIKAAANEEGLNAAASLPIFASTMARKTVYEIARRNAFNKGMKDAGHGEPLKSGEEVIRKMRFGR